MLYVRRVSERAYARAPAGKPTETRRITRVRTEVAAERDGKTRSFPLGFSRAIYSRRLAYRFLLYVGEVPSDAIRTSCPTFSTLLLRVYWKAVPLSLIRTSFYVMCALASYFSKNRSIKDVTLLLFFFFRNVDYYTRNRVVSETTSPIIWYLFRIKIILVRVKYWKFVRRFIFYNYMAKYIIKKIMLRVCNYIVYIYM